MNTRKNPIVCFAAALALAGCARHHVSTCMEYEGEPYDESEASRWSAMDWARAADERAWEDNDAPQTSQGNLCKAQTLYRGALVLEPTNPYAMIGLANGYLLEARYILFHDCGRSFGCTNIEGRPDPDQAAARAVTKLLSRAAERSEQVLVKNPTYAPALLTLAAVYEAQDDFQKAYDMVEKTEKSKVIPEKQYSAFYAWKGYLLMQLRRTEESEVALRKAYSIDDDPRRSRYADCLLNPDDYKLPWYSRMMPWNWFWSCG